MYKTMDLSPLSDEHEDIITTAESNNPLNVIFFYFLSFSNFSYLLAKIILYLN